MFLAAAPATAAPAPVEPVKDTMRTSGWPVKGWPTLLPVPGTACRTSSVRTVFSSSTIRVTVSGACSLGLRTTVLPAARAGAIFPPAWTGGQLNGMISPTTPTGSR